MQVREAVAAASPGYSVEVSDSGREYKVYGGVKGDIEPPGEIALSKVR